MNVQAKKYQLIEWITGIQDVKLINKLVKMAEESDWMDTISREEKEAIQRGQQDLEDGRVQGHSEVKKLYEKYL